jgi:hypothetical protein
MLDFQRFWGAGRVGQGWGVKQGIRWFGLVLRYAKVKVQRFGAVLGAMRWVGAKQTSKDKVVRVYISSQALVWWRANF